MWLAAGALVLATGLGVAALIRTGDAGDGGPRPLFDEVAQLTLASLPDGWARCGGGRSLREDASERWWAQTFGPVEEGECRSLVTVTQIPPDEHLTVPHDVIHGGIGDGPGRTGARRWTDEREGSRGLDTGGSGGLQHLLVEGCCGEDLTADAFELVAEAGRDATREQEPAGCDETYSDLDQESFLDNNFARQQRATDAQGCPVRGDIVSWRTEHAGHHCWPNVTFLRVGSPVGTPFDPDEARTYVRDATGELRAGHGPDPRLDLAAALPETAINTGFQQGGRELWIDEEHDGLVYVASGDHVEAWPLNLAPHLCA